MDYTGLYPFSAIPDGVTMQIVGHDDEFVTNNVIFGM